MKEYLISRLARANLLNDPAAASNWLRDRVDRDTRRAVMDECFPMLRAAAAAA